MKILPLTRGYVTVVDDNVYEWASAHNWYVLITSTGSIYAVRQAGRVTLYLHRLIMQAPAGIDVDHRDGDSLNNCRSNLRLASRGQNNGNSRKPVSGRTSQFKGVCWDTRAQRWLASIKQQNRFHYLGHFHIEAQAARAYDAAARRMRGKFARTNFGAESVEDIAPRPRPAGRQLVQMARSRNSIGYRGVSRQPYGRFQSEIMVNGRKRYLGRFLSAREAALAYDRVASELHGARARLNFPQ